MHVLEPVSLLVCVRCDNGVNIVFAVVVLLVLVGKVGWNKCEQPSPSDPKCGRHVFTHTHIPLCPSHNNLVFSSV